MQFRVWVGSRLRKGRYDGRSGLESADWMDDWLDMVVSIKRVEGTGVEVGDVCGRRKQNKIFLYNIQCCMQPKSNL